MSLAPVCAEDPYQNHHHASTTPAKAGAQLERWQ